MPCLEALLSKGLSLVQIVWLDGLLSIGVSTSIGDRAARRLPLARSSPLALIMRLPLPPPLPLHLFRLPITIVFRWVESAVTGR